MSEKNPEHRAAEPASYVTNPEYAEAEAYQVKPKVDDVLNTEAIENAHPGLKSGMNIPYERMKYGMDKQKVYNSQKAEEMAYAEQDSHDLIVNMRAEIEHYKKLIESNERLIEYAQQRAQKASEHQGEFYDKNLTEEVDVEVIPTDIYNPSGSVTTTTLKDRTTGEVVSTTKEVYDPREGWS